MHVAARINDTPTGKREVIVVLDAAGDAWAPVKTRREAELVADLWGIDPSAVDWSEVGDILR